MGEYVIYKNIDEEHLGSVIMHNLPKKGKKGKHNKREHSDLWVMFVSACAELSQGA